MNINNFARDFFAQKPQVMAPAPSTHLRGDNLDATIYVADLPLSVTYKDLTDVFERQIGPCQDVVIKRHLFKNFHYAYVSFKDATLGKNMITNNDECS